MGVFALAHTVSNVVVDKVTASACPPQPAAGKNLKWLAYTDTPPSFDEDTQTRTKTAPTVTASNYTENYTVADKTDMPAIRALVKPKVRDECEKKRAGYILAGDGHVLGLRELAREGDRWNTTGGPTHNDTNFPLMAAIRDGDGLSNLTAAVSSAVSEFTTWRTAEASILKAERKALKAINAASNAAGVRTAWATLLSDLGAI